MIKGALGLLILAGIAAIPLFNADALTWLAENSDCNGSPCTESEAKTISTVVTGIAATAGVVLFGIGLRRRLAGSGFATRRTKREGFTMSSTSDFGDAMRSGRQQALDRLDETYWKGELSNDEYRRRKAQIERN